MFKKITNNVLAKIGYTIKKSQIFETDKNDFDRFVKYSREHESIKLHFGCGPRILKDWINIDISYAHYEPYLQYYTDKHFPGTIRRNREDLFIINFLKEGIPFP